MGVGLILSARGGGYTPACLSCSKRFRIIVRLRSHALTILDDHRLNGCTAPRPLEAS